MGGRFEIEICGGRVCLHEVKCPERSSVAGLVEG